MTEAATPRGRVIGRALVSVVVAAVLVAAATGVRAALTPMLGALSPFMVYVAAVLVAGLVRGAFCGALVMFASGGLGLWLFLIPHNAPTTPAVVSLMLFWMVSAPVLVTASELRVQLRTAMAKLSDAVERRGAAG